VNSPRTPFQLGTLPAAAVGWLVVVASLGVYVSTMSRTVFGLDSAELAAGAHTLGIVHSPGAPLYMLVGHAFSRLPVGDVGFRLNLMSAVFAALATGLHYLIGLRLTGRAGSSAVGALATATCYYIWAWAMVAELYAPHAFFALLVLWLILKGRETGRPGWIGWAGLAWGLGMGNHTSLSLMVPAYAWLVLSARLPARPKLLGLLLAGGGASLGLLVYLYFPIRHAAHPAVDYVRDYFPGIDLASPAGLWWMFRGGMFSSLFFALSPAQFLRAFGQHLWQLTEAFTPVGLLVAAAGAWSLLRAKPALMAGLVLMWLGHVLFFCTYGALDRQWMFSVSYLVVGLWLGAGVAALVSWSKSRWPAGRVWIPAGIAAVLALQLLNGYRVLNLHRDTSARDYGDWVLGILPPRALFLGLWEQVPILEYMQVAEGRRADVEVVNMVFLSDLQIRQRIARAVDQQRAVYGCQAVSAWPQDEWISQTRAKWTLFCLQPGGASSAKPHQQSRP
jgi:hypothetical protein